MTTGMLHRKHVQRILVLVAVAGVLTGLTVLLPQDRPRAVSAASQVLPFDMPSVQELRSSSKKVFVNYFTPMPLSIDNRPAESDYYSRNFLTPTGEGGVHAAYGGLTRDRPLPRAPVPGADWRLEDLKSEVRQAIAAGIDGFYLDLLQLEGDPDVRVWETSTLMMRAASEVDPGFKIVLMPDLAGGLKNKSQAELAEATATLAQSGAAYRLPDGRLVVMPLAAEAHPAQWWRGYMDLMASRHQLSVALVPMFVATETQYRKSFASISYAMTIWGSANPLWNNPGPTHATSARGRAAAVRAAGTEWVQPVRMQDERPKQRLFSEAENTTNLRTTWQLARESGAVWVHMPTWNDYSEGTQLAPSSQHGFSFLDINSYYLVWYKTGVEPQIVRDVIYVTHRKQPWEATPSYPHQLMKLRGGSPARDTVEVLTFLTAPGIVTVHAGEETHTCSAPSGVGVCTVPLVVGTVSASVTRGTAEVAQVVSPYPVTDKPYVQDLAYVGVSSARPPLQGATPTPQPTQPPTSLAPPSGPRGGQTRTVSIQADFDTYVNQAAPDVRYANETALASRGRPGYTTYLRFVVPAADRRRMVGAKLSITTTTSSFAGSENRHEVYLLPAPEVRRSTSWTNRPAVTGSPVGWFDEPAAPGNRYTARLSVQPLQAGTGSTILLAVTSAGRDNLWFVSSESRSERQRPRLIVTYED